MEDSDVKVEVKIGDIKKTIEIDVSEQACQPYGFLSGDRIVLPNEEGEATVIGVGLPIFGTGDVLWFLRDRNGKYGYWTTAPFESQNLRDHNFYLTT
jgi:hypothetical protein